MKLTSLIISATLALAAIMAGCNNKKSTESILDNIRQAEAAVALGDMEAAKNVAVTLIGTENLSQMSARQLARLSMVYMQMADSTDRDENISIAADLYKQAYKQNADSAAAFYADVEPAVYPYVAMLKTLVERIDHPYDPAADTLDEHSHIHLPEPK